MVVADTVPSREALVLENARQRRMFAPRRQALVSTALDIIVPCYNPPRGWAQALPAMMEGIADTLGPAVEARLVLVNDGSRHGVSDAEIALLQARIPRFLYLHYPANRGKGHALRQGAAAASGDFQIYTDIDFPYDMASLAAVFDALQRGADVAVGVRDDGYYAHVPALRRFISKMLRWMLRTFLRIRVNDTQCGLKGFNSQGKALFLQTRIERFLFDLEFVYMASIQDGLRLEPVPVQLRPGITFSKARLGILLRESLNFAGIALRGLGDRLGGRAR